MDSIPRKHCSNRESCINPNGSLLPLTKEYFHTCNANPDGFSYVCKVCKNAYDRSRKRTPEQKARRAKQQQGYVERHPEYRPKAYKRQAERRTNDPEYRERYRQYLKEYYANPQNHERMRTRQKNRYANDPVFREYWREYTKNYNKSHPQERLISHSKRRARKNGNGGSHTKQDVEILIKNSKGLCWWCGEKIKGKPHIDHRIALSKGGSDNADNLCVSCAKCNLSKSNKLPHEFNGRLL